MVDGTSTGCDDLQIDAEKGIRSCIAILILQTAMTGCASTGSSESGSADFSGTWSLESCDKAKPDAECGGFVATLVQDADRICGTYSSVDSRLMQSDEDGSIHGVVLGKSAVLAVESGRSGAIYLAQIVLDGHRMDWNLRDRIRNADGDIDLLAKDEWLERLGKGTAVNDTTSQRCEFE